MKLLIQCIPTPQVKIYHGGLIHTKLQDNILILLIKLHRENMQNRKKDKKIKNI